MKLNYWLLRIFFVALILFSFWKESIQAFVYVALIWALGETLTHHPRFKYRKPVTFFFLLATIAMLLTWDRTRTELLNPHIELALNRMEHVVFAWIVGWTFYLVASVEQASRFKRRELLFYYFAGYNFIGWLNEVFQNSLEGNLVVAMHKENMIDMAVNFLSALFFVGAVTIFHKKLRNYLKRIAYPIVS
ncbi:MAG: hypothetical protein MH132_07000 [Hydrotalea sp.]|jgi:hypothetical protein|nr:hypothetical protein [Hydrotalea sp.]